jgi:hypothetical protein
MFAFHTVRPPSLHACSGLRVQIAISEGSRILDGDIRGRLLDHPPVQSTIR